MHNNQYISLKIKCILRILHIAFSNSIILIYVNTIKSSVSSKGMDKEMKLFSVYVKFSFHRSLPSVVCLLQVCHRKRKKV